MIGYSTLLLERLGQSEAQMALAPVCVLLCSLLFTLIVLILSTITCLARANLATLQMEFIKKAPVLHREMLNPGSFSGGLVDQFSFPFCRHSEFKVAKMYLGREAKSTLFQSNKAVDHCFICVAGLYVVD